MFCSPNQHWTQPLCVINLAATPSSLLIEIANEKSLSSQAVGILNKEELEILSFVHIPTIIGFPAE